MSRPADSSRPCLAPGCRLSDAPGHEATLLIPEGALRLNGLGLKIVERCDGRHTFTEIIGELRSAYSSTGAQKIEEETAGFLEKLREKRAVDF